MSEVKMPSNDSTADHLRDIYPSNSKLQPPVRTERPQHIEKVTVSETVEQKPSLGRRILKAIIPEDMDEIKRYLKEDLIIPSIQTGIISALEMIFFHRTSGYGMYRPTDYTKSNRGPTTYTYSSQNGNVVNAGQPRTMNGGIKTIVYKSRSDAESVLRVLDEQIMTYGEASVMQYYDASDVDSQFTDAKWGWRNLTGARIYPCPGGYTIQMPKTILLD